jgi:hypothetical protein
VAWLDEAGFVGEHDELGSVRVPVLVSRWLTWVLTVPAPMNSASATSVFHDGNPLLGERRRRDAALELAATCPADGRFADGRFTAMTSAASIDLVEMGHDLTVGPALR